MSTIGHTTDPTVDDPARTDEDAGAAVVERARDVKRRGVEAGEEVDDPTMRPVGISQAQKGQLWASVKVTETALPVHVQTRVAAHVGAGRVVVVARGVVEGL